VSLVSHDETGLLRDIQRLLKRDIEFAPVAGYEPASPLVLTGSAGNVRPVQKPQQRGARPQGSGRPAHAPGRPGGKGAGPGKGAAGKPHAGRSHAHGGKSRTSDDGRPGRREGAAAQPMRWGR
jgi:ATP-dependent RNA helicase RhlE